MLNLKKGLAIVLAAATALTFAPVSTLGLQGVVEAQASVISPTSVKIHDENGSDKTGAYKIASDLDVKQGDTVTIYTTNADGILTAATDATYVSDGSLAAGAKADVGATGQVSITQNTSTYNAYVAPTSDPTSTTNYKVVKTKRAAKTKAEAQTQATSDFITVTVPATNVDQQTKQLAGADTKVQPLTLKAGSWYKVTPGTGKKLYTAEGDVLTDITPASGAYETDVLTEDKTIWFDDDATAANRPIVAQYNLSDPANGVTSNIELATGTIYVDEAAKPATPNNESLVEGTIQIPKQAYATNGEQTGANPDPNYGKGSNEATVIAGVEQVIRLNDGSGFYLKGARIRVENNRSDYHLFNDGGLQFYSDTLDVNRTTTFANDANSAYRIYENQNLDQHNTNAYDTNANGHYVKLGIFVPKSDTFTFTFSDQSNASQKQSASEITVKLDASNHSDNIPNLDIVRVDNIATKTTGTGAAAVTTPVGFEKGSSTRGYDRDLYSLALNDTTYGYALTGLANSKKTNINTWTGVEKQANVSLTDDTTEYVDQAGILKKLHYEVSTGVAKATKAPHTDDAALYDTNGDLIANNQDFVLFKPQTTTVSYDQLKVKVKATYDGNTITTELPVTVDKSAKAIDYVTFKGKYDASTYVSDESFKGERYDQFINKISQVYDYDNAVFTGSDDTYYINEHLDPTIRNSGVIGVKAEGSYYFKSSDPTILDINEQTGEFTVKDKGSVEIYVFVASTQNNYAKVATIYATSYDYATDHIDASFSKTTDYRDNVTNLDKASQTKGSPIKTDTVTVESVGGLDWTISSGADTPYFTVVKNADGKTATVTAKDTAGTGTFTIKTLNDQSKRIEGTTKTFTVNVWNNPAAQFTIDDILVNTGANVSLGDSIHVTDPASYKVAWDAETNQDYYTLTNDPTAANNQTSSRLQAGNAVGKTAVYATVTGNGIHPTTRKATVTVKNDSVVATVKPDKTLVTLEVGGTETVTATASNNAIVTFAVTSGNDVATVTSAGAITALKAGNATIEASAPGAVSATINVVVNSNAKDVETVEVPAKVKTVKVRNVKGAKAKISYSQLADVDGYKVVYKYKKNGKLVRKTFVNASGKGSKTVSVPKNTSVKVWVRAFRLNSKGQRVNAPYKTATFKTDNK